MIKLRTFVLSALFGAMVFGSIGCVTKRTITEKGGVVSEGYVWKNPFHSTPKEKAR